MHGKHHAFWQNFLHVVSSMQSVSVFMKYPKLCNSAGKRETWERCHCHVKCHHSWCRRRWEVGEARLGHGLLLCRLRAQQRWAGPLQPKQVGEELSRGSLGNCNLLSESDLASYEPDSGWLHSMDRSGGRCWGLAANSSSLCSNLATPYSPAGFAPFLHLYWANCGCGRENGDTTLTQTIVWKADI